VPLEAIWGSDAVELADRMATAASAIDRLRILEHALVRRVPNPADGSRAVAHIAELIEVTEGLARIHDLSRECGLSDRALLYRFDECAGLTPKQYARIVRLRACIARLDAWSSVDWAALAAEHSFCDQAHLVREFRHLLGTSPSTFLRQRHAYSSVAAPAVGRSSVPHRDQRLYSTLGFVSRWDR
jgi:AraC-like DNA-binding protein